MSLQINDEYFGELLPYIKNDSITDITWNGRDLWLDDLKRGRYKSQVKLSNQFVNTFATRIANLANKNFNLSEPLLEAETDDLRISIVDGTVTNTNRSIAIRKTPAVRRLNELKMMEDGYAEAMVLKLLEALVKGHSSIIVTGDVGSGKTELIKYLTKFIPPYERAISIEDNYELRLSSINPNLDCVEIKATMDGPFSYQDAIKAALRQLCKWLLMAEARSKEVINLLEAASTGCIVMTTLHSDDVRKIPDRVVNMMGIDGEEKRNDVYNFFDVGIKVGITKTDRGIKRSIDQICVMDRDENENNLYLIYNRGFTGQTLPNNLWQKVVQGAKDDIDLFEFLKPDNAESYEIVETPEFAEMMEDLETTMKENFIAETKDNNQSEFDTPDIEDITEVIDLFDDLPSEPESVPSEADNTAVYDTLGDESTIPSALPETTEMTVITSEPQEEIRNIDDMTEILDQIQPEAAATENHNSVMQATPVQATGLIDVPEYPSVNAQDNTVVDSNVPALDKEVAPEIAEETQGRHFKADDVPTSPESLDKYYDDVAREASAAELSVLDAFFDELDRERENLAVETNEIQEPMDFSAAETIISMAPTALEHPDSIPAESGLVVAAEEIVAEPSVIEAAETIEAAPIPEETPENISNVLSIFEQISEQMPESISAEDNAENNNEDYVQEAFKGIDFAKLENLEGATLIRELKKQLTINWLRSLNEDDLAAELRREIELVEECNKTGAAIPEHELIKIQANLERQ